MSDEDTSFWFPVKTYGWGWGLPVRWQGWVVLVAYAALLFFGIPYLVAERDVVAFLLYVVGITVLLIVVIVAKGERPAAWRWGKK
jgi:hypothetical protein